MLPRTLLGGVLVAALTVGPIISAPGHDAPRSASAACRKAPPVQQSGTRFGISLSTSNGQTLGQDLAAEERRFGTRIPVVRTWDPSVPPSNAWERRKPWFGSRWIVTSMKIPPAQVLSGRHDAALRHYFRTAPRRAPIFWNYWHEPEDEVRRGEFGKRQYRRAFRHIVRLAASTCRSNLHPTLILMGWTADPRSGLDWRDYYPGRRHISVLAWDPYNSANGNPRSYVAPKTLFRNVVRVTRAAGKPLGIAETGSELVSGDRGAGRAEWLRKTGRHLKRKDALFVTYFQSLNNGDFELRDRASVDAWKRWLRN